MALDAEEKLYPSSDGEPMTDKDINRILMEYFDVALSDRYADDPLVYVSANLFIYYKEGDPKKNIAPDVFVVKGVPKGERDHYKLWNEGQVPQVVFEFVARRTKQMDVFGKKQIYQRLGVLEYYIFDPKLKLKPPFQVFRLENGAYRELDAPRGIFSPELGLDLIVRDNLLLLSDPQTHEILPLPIQAYGELRREKERADREADRADRLAAELERMRRMLEER